MNKKTLLMLAPAFLVFGALTSCNSNPKVKSIVAYLRDKTKMFLTDSTISKSDFVVMGKYSDDSTKELTDWTSSEFTSDTYKFVDADVPTKTFHFKYNEMTATYDVTVIKKETHVSDIKLDKTELSFNLGDPTKKIVATIEPEGATNKKINWTVDKIGIIELDSTESMSGEEMGISLLEEGEPGTVVVTASSDEDPTKTATCTVTVKGEK